MTPTPEIIAAAGLLLVATIILSAGVAGGLIARVLRIPDIALFLLIGLAFGPSALGLVDVPAKSTASQLILTFGAAYILFDGGALVKLRVMKRVWISVVLFATVGVVMTALVTALAAGWLLGLPALVALLLGAVMAPTDPATLVPVFRQVNVRENVAQMAVAESAFNDPIGASLVFVIVSLLAGGGIALGQTLVDFAWEAAIGLIAGAAAGWLACVLMARMRLGFFEEYLPLVSLIVVAGAYIGAGRLHASGFMGVFAAGLVIGNKETLGFTGDAGEGRKVDDFIETTALIMRMFIFILLGAQVDFSLLAHYLLPGLGVVAIFMFVARPLTVFLLGMLDRRARWSMKELLFLSWTRETGVIPGALAGLLVGAKVEGAEAVAAVTFIAILSTILLQATTAGWLARRLGLVDRPT